MCPCCCCPCAFTHQHTSFYFSALQFCLGSFTSNLLALLFRHISESGMSPGRFLVMLCTTFAKYIQYDDALISSPTAITQETLPLGFSLYCIQSGVAFHYQHPCSVVMLHPASCIQLLTSSPQIPCFARFLGKFAAVSVYLPHLKKWTFGGLQDTCFLDYIYTCQTIHTDGQERRHSHILPLPLYKQLLLRNAGVGLQHTCKSIESTIEATSACAGSSCLGGAKKSLKGTSSEGKEDVIVLKRVGGQKKKANCQNICTGEQEGTNHNVWIHVYCRHSHLFLK